MTEERNKSGFREFRPPDAVVNTNDLARALVKSPFILRTVNINPVVAETEIVRMEITSVGMIYMEEDIELFFFTR